MNLRKNASRTKTRRENRSRKITKAGEAQIKTVATGFRNGGVGGGVGGESKGGAGNGRGWALGREMQ